MYAEDGTLMATASQSCIARIHRDPNDDADAVVASGRGKP
jgi:hypothetical protein